MLSSLSNRTEKKMCSKMNFTIKKITDKNGQFCFQETQSAYGVEAVQGYRAAAQEEAEWQEHEEDVGIHGQHVQG
jgi:hypothetical protein